MSEKQVAIRLFENPRYGTTYGKGLYRLAVYNATAELSKPHTKYLLDFMNGEAFSHFAREQEQLNTVRYIGDSLLFDDAILYSWIRRYDPRTKEKSLVGGYCAFILTESKIYLHLEDELGGHQDLYALDVRACSRNADKSSPDFLATNCDLREAVFR